MKKNYIKAVLEMIENGDDIKAVLKGLKNLLAVRGHERLLPAVLQGVVRELDNWSDVQSVVTVAKK